MTCPNCSGTTTHAVNGMEACSVCGWAQNDQPIASVNMKSLMMGKFPKVAGSDSHRCDACTQYFVCDGDISATVEIRSGTIWRVKLTLCLSCQRGIKSVFSNYIHDLRGAHTGPIFEEESPDKGGRNLIL